jgi:hypothetical protein
LEDCRDVSSIRDISLRRPAGRASRGRPRWLERSLPWRRLGRGGWDRLAGDPVLIAVAAAALGAIIWLIVFPRVGTDLSAQIARADWARHYPGSAYLFNWYGGIYPASYSPLAPYLLAVTGTRQAMAVAVVVSAGLLAVLLVRHRVSRPRAAAVWTAVALWTDLSAGRATFTLGLAAALGSVAVADGSRPHDRLSGRLSGWPRMLAAAGLAMLSCLLSPVAGLFLGVPAAAFLLTGRRREGLVVGLAAALPLGVMALLPGGGVQPIGIQNGLPSLLAAAGIVLLVPPRWRVVRIGAIVYGLGVIAVWAVPTPIGSNVERLGELLGGPLLAGLVSGKYRRLLLVPALVAVAGWQVAQPVSDLGQGNAPPYRPQTAALVRELRAVDADTARVEAVPQYGHWESQELSSAVPLARGWERQLDTVRNRLFYRGTLTPASYYGWLRYNAVRYVAISAATPDPAAVAEAAVVRAGQPWLVPVWHDAFWRLYQVAGTLPLASPPAVITGSTPAEITLRMRRAGTTIVRVRWSPLLRATGDAILAQRGPWTSLGVGRAGVYILSAPY